MSFFDMPSVPLHHGQPVTLRAERVIDPTNEEASDGVLEVGVTPGYCSLSDCRERFFYTRYRYPGGWGPIHRVRDGKQISQLSRRIKLARESDWVKSSLHEYPYTQRKVVVR